MKPVRPLRRNITFAVLASVATMSFIQWFVMSGKQTNFKPPTQQWFYNMTTGELLAMGMDQIPPLVLGNGERAVRARVFNCNKTDVSTALVVMLEAYPPNVAARLQSPLPFAPDSPQAVGEISERDALTQSALLVALPPQTPGADTQWFSIDTPQGEQIRHRIDSVCASGKPLEVFP